MNPVGILAAYEETDHEKMAEIRARAEAIVNDRETAEKLKAWYRQLCKRPCFHDEYLQSFNNPNTHLIDTDGKGVERITEKGLVVAGKEYEVDCIIYASGFEVGTSYQRRSGFDAVGRDGSETVRLLGRMACAACTASMSMAFRTCISSIRRRART
jgi:cation diffusion facilitator CzcD-associated flavoprotein CzcO